MSARPANAPGVNGAARGDASPWLEPKAARPLRAWTAHQHDELANSVGEAFAAWSDAWGLGRPADAARCGSPRTASLRGTDWLALRGARGDAPMGWLQLASQLEDRLADAWFPPPQAGARGPLANAVLAQARGACIAALAGAVGLEPEAAPAPQAAAATPDPQWAWPWSGAVQVSLPGPLGGRLLLSGDAVQHWLSGRGHGHSHRARHAARGPLVPVLDAASARRICLSVRLHGCDIELGALQALARGDVVRLAHPITSPAALVDAAGALQLPAWLGRSGGRRAVQLAAASSCQEPSLDSSNVQSHP